MIDRLVCLFVAVSLALLVWLYARSRDQEILDHVPIPVHVALPTKQCGQDTPETILVRGPQEVVERLSAIATQPWILPHQAKSRDGSAPSARVPLVHDIETRPISCEPPFVRVRTSTQPYRTYTLSDVPIHFLC